MKTVLNTALAATSIFAIACGGQDVTTADSWTGAEDLNTVAQEPSSASDEALADELGGIPVADEALADELEGKLNAYALALLDRDVGVLNGLMSTEVLGQINAKGMDMGAFADKMSNAMLRTFDTMTSNSELGFSVDSVRIEGNAVRVAVSRHGEALGKPFYFVDEQGEYKLNLVSPGFSRPLADGAAGSWNTYIVENIGPSDFGTVSAYCTTGTQAYIQYGHTANMSCTDKCGAIFSGGRFFANQGQYNETYKYCDYNTWGVDASYYFNQNSSVFAWAVSCNDEC